MIGSQQPTLEQCNNAVDLGQQVPTDGSFFTDHFVDIAKFGQSAVASPSVCVDGAARLDTLFNGNFQPGARGIRYTPEPNPPDLSFFDLYHDNNQRLARCPSAPLPWFLPTYVDLIHLNRARKPVPSRSHHSMTELVQPCPGGLIAAQIENALQSERVGSIFLTRQVPDSTKPKPQRLSGILEYRTGCNGGFVATTDTAIQLSLHGPGFRVSAARASKPLGPAKLEQIFDACFFSAKPLFKLKQCFWIALHGRLSYIPALGESTR